MIKDYFYNDAFYKKIIAKKKDSRIINEYKKILKYRKMIKFVYQNKTWSKEKEKLNELKEKVSNQ